MPPWIGRIDYLKAWAAAQPGTSDEGLTPKQEIKAIQDAMDGDATTEFFVPVRRARASHEAGGRRSVELQ